MERAGEDLKYDRSALDLETAHENSLVHLESYLRQQHGSWLLGTVSWEPWRAGEEQHLDPELQKLSDYFRLERARSGHSTRLANINHDIRSPLAAQPVLSRYLQLLQNEYPNDTLLREARATLDNLESVRPRQGTLTVEQLNHLLHLKEVIEFIAEADRSAIQIL